MAKVTSDLGPSARAAFDAIIDVRSPSEFAEDHVPGAINLPVLDDAERAEIGTMFVQQSKFLARRLGAAKVARNIARHLDGPLSDRGGGFKPLVYCWRGGQRSGAMTTVMDQVGWPVTKLEGGYQTWRRGVAARLYPEGGADWTGPPIVLLDGPTGSGKTETLALLAERGAQVLDLEALADHRGSLFGATDRPQPSQKMFETRLTVALEGMDPARPLVVEAESSRIGQIALPPTLWSAMKAAPRIELAAGLEARAGHILATYADIGANREDLEAALSRLPLRHGRQTLKDWIGLARTGQLEPLVHALLEAHYDPAYRRSAARLGPARGAAPSPIFGSEGDRRAAVEAILGLVGG